MVKAATALLTVPEVSERLQVSVSTVWRLIRRGALPSVRKGGRRLVPEDVIIRYSVGVEGEDVPPFTEDHPIFRLIGAGRGGGRRPGARDKHGTLDQ